MKKFSFLFIAIVLLACTFSFTACKHSSGFEFTETSDKSGYVISGITNINQTEMTIPATYKNKPVVGIDISYSSYPFRSCEALTKITIPSSISFIAPHTFSECYTLKEVHISDLASWCSIDFGNESANPLDYAHNLYLNGKLVTKIVLPETISVVKEYAFERILSLVSVTIPKNINSLESYAFDNCYRLVEIYNYSDLDISGSTISKYAIDVYTSAEEESKLDITDDGFIFYTGEICKLIGYIGMQSELTLPEFYKGDRVYELHAYAFRLSNFLTKIYLPDLLMSIGEMAFFDCFNLKDIYINKSIAHWELLPKGKYWDYETDGNKRIYTIHCTDGEIKINQAD